MAVVCDFAIIGGGPAGLIASAILARQGHDIALFGEAPQSSSQALHVHRLADASWDRLVQLAGPDAELPQEWPGRPIFDQLLADFAGGLSHVMQGGRYTSADYSNGVWQVSGTTRNIEARWLIDCSGARRATARSVSGVMGTPLCIDEVEHSVSYASWFLATPADEGSCGPVSCWCPQWEAGLLVELEASGLTRFTLQDYSSGRYPADIERLCAILEESGQLAFLSVLSVKEALVGPHIWPTVPASFADIAQVCGADVPWIALGDALLITPPSLGWGLTSLAEHLSILDRHARANSLADAGMVLDALCRHRFMQAMMASQLRTLPELLHS